MKIHTSRAPRARRRCSGLLHPAGRHGLPPGTDFSKYKTFTLKHGAAARNAIAVERFELALGNALSARRAQAGLRRRRPERVDHFVIGKDTQLNTYGTADGAGAGAVGAHDAGRADPTGTVVVDLVDPQTNKMVWRGVAKDELSTTATPEQRQQKADEVARKLFENFPPKAAK